MLLPLGEQIDPHDLASAAVVHAPFVRDGSDDEEPPARLHVAVRPLWDRLGAGLIADGEPHDWT